MPGAAANEGTRRLAIRADRAFGGREMIPGGALVLCASRQIAGRSPAPRPRRMAGRSRNFPAPPCSRA